MCLEKVDHLPFAGWLHEWHMQRQRQDTLKKWLMTLKRNKCVHLTSKVTANLTYNVTFKTNTFKKCINQLFIQSYLNFNFCEDRHYAFKEKCTEQIRVDALKPSVSNLYSLL
jgi:hypothetical protein